MYLKNKKANNPETIRVTYKCELCFKEFSQKSSRNRHVREQHLQPGAFKCKQCGLRFSKKYNLQTHMNHVHPKFLKPSTKYFKCSQCTCLFSTTAALKKHIKLYHKQIEKQDNSHHELDQCQETDPQVIADSVLRQLRQLQNDIQTTEPAASSDDNKPQQTSVEIANIEEISIRDNLYPGEQFKLVKVQTIKRSNGLTYFVCGYCSKEFRKTYNYLRHARIHNHVKPYICVLCKKSFPTAAQLKAHCSIHKFNETFGIYSKFYKCPHCQEGFSAINKLDKHISTNSSQCNATFRCPECLKSFKTLTNVLRHKHNEKDKELQLLKAVLPKPQFIEECEDLKICRLCGLKLNSKIILEQHEKSHENLSKYQCLECKQKYATECSLRIHSRSPTKFKTYKCCYCFRKFTTNQTCRSHMMAHLKHLLNTPKKVSEENIKRFPTIVMQKENTLITETAVITKIQQSKSLSGNYLTEERNFKYKCSQCNKSYRYQAWLKKHFQYKHTINVSNYECSECLKKFRTKQSLSTHFLTHSKEREKFTCQVCARQYGSKKSLKLHLRIHTEEKPFQCYKCLKLFRTSGHLKQHRKSNHSK